MKETVGSALIALKNRSGLSLTAIARGAGYSGPSSVQAFFHVNYDPPGLDISVAQKLCQALVGKGSPPIEEQEVYALLGVKIPNIGSEKSATRRNFLDSDVPVFESRYSYGIVGPLEAIPGLAFAAVNFTAPYRYYPRASGLAWNDNAYALHMIGHNMAPRFKEGEPFFVSPGRSPISNDDVLIKIQRKNDIDYGGIYDLVTFGRFAGQDDIRVSIHQYGTDRSVNIPNRLILGIDRIATWSEVCGLPYA